MDETNEKTWPEVSFEDLSDKLKDACGRAGWTTLMPVQSRTMAAVFDRKDIMVQARTGSGKTGAFVLPLIERIDPEKNCCQALVLLPTRELAKQVADEAENLSGGKVRTVPVYGGVGYGPQVDGFRKGAHLVVGTPGRILDHLMRGNLDVSQLDTLVFDEADRMLSIGFYPDMKQLQSYLPERDIHGLMFSATFPPLVLRLSEEFLRDPQFISLSEDHVHVAEVTHAYYQVPGMGKERALARLIETENPSSAIIFTNTKANCNFVAAVLSQFGYNADPLSSDLSQAKREQVLNRVRAGTLRFLVATDVAARGIDIPELSHVFLYEPPEDRESYIHRSGRTGRAGAAGEVISLVDLMQKMELKRIGEHYRIPLVERELPDDKTVRSVVAERTTALLEARLREVPEPERERLSLLRSMAADLAAKVDSVGYLAMLLDEFYHLSVHGVSAPVRKGPAEGDNPVLDEGRIADHLERDWKSMKPLSRERMMKFMPLARSLAEESDGLDDLAMLLEEYFFNTVYTSTLPKPKVRPKARPRPKTPAKTEAPAPREAETSPHTELPQETAAPAAETAPPEETNIQPAPEPKRPARPRRKTADKRSAETEAAPEQAEEIKAENEPAQATEATPEPKNEEMAQPERIEKPAPKVIQPLDNLLEKLKTAPALSNEALSAFEPLAKELLADADAPTIVAMLLDRFDHDSRRRKPRHARNGRSEERSENRPESRRQDNRQQEQPAHTVSRDESLAEVPYVSSVPPWERLGQRPGPSIEEQPPKPKKRPRRRPRKKA